MIDLHVHSIASGHAINTVNELICYAEEKGLTHLGITDHGPSMKGSPHQGYFWISDKIPREVRGIKIYLGIEANILDTKGTLDLEYDLLAKQRLVLAGLHHQTPYSGVTIEDNTNAIVGAINSGYCQIITHPYRKDFPVDIERITYAALKQNVLLELNNQVFGDVDDELLDNYTQMIRLVKEKKSYIILGSDSHTNFTLGNFENVMRYSDRLGLIPEIIINNYQYIVESLLE